TSTDAGVHVFSITLKRSGTQAITATDTASSSLSGSQTGITVNPAGTSASTLVLSGFPSPVTAGTTGNVTVTAQDQFGNTVTGYTGTVHFTSSDSQATLPTNYTFTSPDAGVHVFSVALKTPGTQAITATDTADSTITGSQTGITVSAAAASLVVSGFPSPIA